MLFRSVPGVLDCRIAPGTADFTLGPAMSRAEAVEAAGWCKAGAEGFGYWPLSGRAEHTSRL